MDPPIHLLCLGNPAGRRPLNLWCPVGTLGTSRPVYWRIAWACRLPDHAAVNANDVMERYMTRATIQVSRKRPFPMPWMSVIRATVRGSSGCMVLMWRMQREFEVSQCRSIHTPTHASAWEDANFLACPHTAIGFEAASKFRRAGIKSCWRPHMPQNLVGWWKTRPVNPQPFRTLCWAVWINQRRVR